MIFLPIKMFPYFEVCMTPLKLLDLRKTRYHCYSRVRLMAISYVNWRIKQRGSRKDNLPH